jgi:hypothetical protein
MINPISPTSLVLVGILPDVRDLEIARLLGWYRIPLRFAPKVIDVDFLAFYQTAAFGDEHRWKIEYYGEVLGHELTTRVGLFKDEPDHPRANEEYFKIQIGQLQTLPHPIAADRWRRLTFIYTTGDHLLQAVNIRDLAIRNEEKGLIWNALRERSASSNQYLGQSAGNFSIDPEILPFIEGWLESEYPKDQRQGSDN